MDEARHLGRLAKDNPLRTAILQERKQRSSSRSRPLTCPSCHSHWNSNRGKDDICPQCLYDIWQAQDVATASKNGAVSDKVIAVRTAGRSHYYPHPSIGFSRHSDVPTDAVFSRVGSWDKPETSPARVMQELFFEILQGMSEVYPVPPGLDTTTFLASSYESDMQTMMPKKTLAALFDLWAFIQWVTKDAYASGYSEGKDLINGMITGTLTADAFADTIARQTATMREYRDRAAKGK